MYIEIFRDKGPSCLQLTHKWFRKNKHIEREREKLIKQTWQNINNWGIWVLWEYDFFVLVSQLFYKFEIISK